MVTRINLRRSLEVLILLVALLPGVVFAQTPQTVNADAPSGRSNSLASLRLGLSVKSRIEKTLPGYRHHNLSLKKDNRAFFFAYHPKNEKIPFGWYSLSGSHSTVRAKRIISSSEFSLLFRAAFSPDGKELLTVSKTGEVAVTDLKTNRKTILGVFTTKIGLSEFASFSFPAYTPDGKYILLHNSWENTILIIDAAKKDIAEASVAKGFWISAIGGESPESGEFISVYEFSADGKQVTFGPRPPDSGTSPELGPRPPDSGTSPKLGKHQVLDLATFKKK